MKIVVNKCFGGFALSDKAIRRILQIKEKGCYLYTQTMYKHREGKNKYERVGLDEKSKGFITYTFTEDQGDSFENFPKDGGYFYEGDLPRTDAALIQAVEELGKEANGSHADLEVIEIPDGIEWELNEYDGIESIHEKHRSW